MSLSRRNIVFLKWIVWLACLGPLVRLAFKGYTGGLGANPIEFITLSLGTWTLILLLATLSVTPLRILTGINWLIRFRRLIGLFVFFYACLHFLTYIWLDKFFDLKDIAKDVVKRPFITMGFSAFLLMIPLALTSTARAVQRLGGRKWRWVHRLIYVIGLAAVIHFWWKVKADTRWPLVSACVLSALLSFRFVDWLRARGSR